MTSTAVEVIPDRIPVQRLQQLTYCERLFYLEWTTGQFEPNQYTAEGSFIHRAVDSGGGRMGGADSADPVRAARSVSLGDDDLGITGVIDIIEHDDGKVVPVEYKHGSPPDQGPAWLPHQIQLCAHGLLLMNAGYEVEYGEIYYEEVRKRIKIDFDEKLIADTLKSIRNARVIAMRQEAPPPLVDSPKCPNCSLVGICLPDEVNHQAGRSVDPPRRLTPRDSAARPMYVTTQGAKIGTRGKHIVVSLHGEELKRELEINVSQINIIGNAQISSQLLRRAFDRDMNVSWFTYGNWFKGMAVGLPGKNIELRRRQYEVGGDGSLPIAKSIVRGKILNSRTLLMRNAKARSEIDEELGQLRHLANTVDEAETLEELLGKEGAAARSYFSRFTAMLTDFNHDDFDFNGRNRRPPRDAVNALLSFGYALLTNALTAAAHGVGFDPYMGVMHKPRFGRPALALDLAEEFRPLIAESVVISVLNNGEITPADFTVRAQAYALKDDPRRTFISAFERRLDQEITHPTYGYKITYRRALELQARVLGAHILGEIPEYEPLLTR